MAVKTYNPHLDDISRDDLNKQTFILRRGIPQWAKGVGWYWARNQEITVYCLKGERFDPSEFNFMKTKWAFNLKKAVIWERAITLWYRKANILQRTLFQLRSLIFAIWVNVRYSKEIRRMRKYYEGRQRP